MLARIVTNVGEERAVKALERFILDRSEYVVTARHPLEIFVKRINQYNAGPPPAIGNGAPARKSIERSVTLGRV